MADTQQVGAGYVFGNAWQQEDERLSLMEAGWDPYSIHNLSALGDMEGWRCLEVGAGGGSMARWLAQRVGPTGHVLATDVDTQLVARLPSAPNLEIQQHDIVADEVEQGVFDLVHTRLVLEHLPQRERALRNMVTALKPGGWLVAEEFDHLTMLPAAGDDSVHAPLWTRFTAAFTLVAHQRGLDLSYGRKLAGDLKSAGLQRGRAEAKAQFNPGGCPLSRVLSLSIARMREPLVATNAVNAAELDHMMTLLDDPAFVWMSQLMVVAWGQRP